MITTVTFTHLQRVRLRGSSASYVHAFTDDMHVLVAEAHEDDAPVALRVPASSESDGTVLRHHAGRFFAPQPCETGRDPRDLVERGWFRAPFPRRTVSRFDHPASCRHPAGSPLPEGAVVTKVLDSDRDEWRVAIARRGGDLLLVGGEILFAVEEPAFVSTPDGIVVAPPLSGSGGSWDDVSPLCDPALALQGHLSRGRAGTLPEVVVERQDLLTIDHGQILRRLARRIAFKAGLAARRDGGTFDAREDLARLDDAPIAVLADGALRDLSTLGTGNEGRAWLHDRIVSLAAACGAPVSDDDCLSGFRP